MPYVPSSNLASAWSISSTWARACADKARSRLAFDVQRVALTGLLVELDIARLEVGDQRICFGLQVEGLAGIRGPLGEERLMLPFEELRVER